MAAPGDAALAAFLAAHRDQPLSYAPVGCTLAGQAPAGMVLDRACVELGTGAGCEAAARQALRSWQMFALPWMRVFPTAAPLAVDTCVAVAVRACGWWWNNVCRIVAVVDEPGRFGFVYGTTRAHAESGEELFLVETGADQRVRFVIVAISRPRHPLARLARPLVRALQGRFRRDATQAMARAVSGSATP